MKLWLPVITSHLLMFIGFPAAAQEGVAPPSPLSLEWCLERAITANPAIAADAASAEAAEHRVVPAGALDDPRIGYQASNVPVKDLDFDSTPLSGQQLVLAQKLPFPGLLKNREEAARAGANAAMSQLVDRQRRIAAAVETTWTELGFAQRALEITDQNLELLRQLTRIAESKYRVGTGLQPDVLRAQVELTRLLDERLQRQAAIDTSEAALAAVLDLPPDVDLPPTGALDEISPLPQVDHALNRLEESSPLLHALAARIEEAERLRRAAVFEGYPDFDLGIGYRLRKRVAGDPVSGDDFLLAGVTVRIPLNRRKWNERVAERGALVRRARADHRGVRAELRDQVRSAHANLERADAQVSLLSTGLVPQARQSLESSRSGYEVDKVDFLSLIDSQIRLLEAELSLLRAVADRRASFARLEAAIGEKLR